MPDRRPRPRHTGAPEGEFSVQGPPLPPPPPLRPDQRSPFADLDPTAVGMLLPPPRPDVLPGAVTHRVRRYLRRPVWKPMAVYFGILMLGVVIGLATTIGQEAQSISDERLFGGNLPADFTVFGIFLHNALVALIPALLFPLLFWAPAATVGVTGFVVGRLAGLWQALHLPNGALILALIPHGVLEIPAFLLAGTLVWRLGLSSWDNVRFGGSWWTRVKAGTRVALPLFALVVAALAVAAAIEVKVTPTLVHAVYPDL